MFLNSVLIAVSLEDHSNNDCLLVTVISHGKEDGQIAAADEDFFVEDLWENFVGDNCESLIGKPKLFFIDSNRGWLKDTGASMELKQIRSIGKNNENLIKVIPKSADLLVMYSTTEGYSSFHNETDGSRFIQALCEEFKINLEDDDNLLSKLTRVSRKVALVKQSNTPGKPELNVGAQMANIESTLTKLFFLFNKSSIEPKCINPLIMTDDMYYDYSNANRGIALIFNHEYFDDKPRKEGTKKDGDDLKAVLEELQFDVRYHMNLKVNDIFDILFKGKTL